MTRSLLLLFCLFLGGCVLRMPPQATRVLNCEMSGGMLPRLIGVFETLDCLAADYLIVHNIHPELDMDEKGILFSKKFNWKVDLHYNVSEWLETETHILLEIGPSVWDMGLGDEMLVWLRKSDGSIIRWARIDGRVNTGILEDDIFYYLDTQMKAYCISLGD